MEIKEFNGEGYMPLISNGGWRVAVVNFCDRLREEKLCRMERHTKTDEVFILLSGEAKLHIGAEWKTFPMETGKVYNVKCMTWHCISMSEGAKVTIVENDDTTEENTEYLYFER